MNLIEQLAEYQNAPIPSLEAAKKGANPNISPWVAGAILSDRIEKQKRMAMQQGAAQGQQPTVDEQQDMEVEGIMQALSQQGAGQAAGQEQAAPQGPVMAAEGGLMQASVDPRMFDYSTGGIIAFSGEGRSDVPAADENIYDPVTGVAIAGPSTREGDDMTLREAMGLGNVENRRALEKLERDQREAEARKAAKAEKDKADEDERKAAELLAAYPVQAPPKARPQAAPGGAAPGGAGITRGMGSVEKAVTGSPEWATMETARTKAFEAPDMPTTAGGYAAERAAHLKAQGIKEMPWESVDRQTKELLAQLGQEDFARAKKREEDTGRKGFHEIVANMGTGSFGQSGAAGLRAHFKAEAEREAEDQRIRELRYNQRLKLNELNNKAQELRYNEATGDVAAAQKSRQDLATLKRQYEKDQASMAKEQATLRERGAAVDATNATTLAAARERQSAAMTLTPFQKAKIRDMAADNVNASIKAGGVPMQLAMKKDPGLRERMVAQETQRILAEYGSGEGAAPVQSQYGPPPQGAVRLKK